MAQSSQLGLSRQQVKNLRFRDLYLSGSTIDLGGTKISRDAASGGITIASASGGTVDSRVKNLFADGTITASNLNIIGDYVTMQTTTSNTEMMVIENAGTGPALKVTQTGANSIAEFYDDGGVLALKIADGGNVGIGTSAPLQKLDVIGTVQATGFSGSGALVTSLNVDNVSLGSLAVARGGTNIQSYTVGDLIYATGATALSKLADVATGNALISGGVGVVPAWGKIGLTTHVSGTLGVANGGTGAASLTANKVLVGNGTTGVLQPTNLHWDDANSRLGIGIASPLANMHVMSTSTTTGLIVQNADVNMVLGNVGGTVNGGSIQVRAGSVSSIGTTNYTLCLNPEGGSVGIGTTLVQATLHVSGIIKNKNPSFAAVLTSRYFSNEFVFFNDVRHNEGDNYNSANGRFTAPVTGTYFFSMHGHRDGNNGNAYFLIYVNDNAKIIIYTETATAGSYNGASGTALFPLLQNDSVRVFTSSSLFPANNQFAGFLIG
jgi:hypothetical protein